MEVNSEAITAPTITAIYDLTSPASSVDEIIPEGGALLIKWTASDVKAGIETSGVRVTELWHKYMEVPVPKWEPTGLSLRGTGGIFTYTPTKGDGTYYFATRSVDRAGNWEAQPNGDGDTSINYIASINTDPTGKEGGGGGCFIDTLLPAHCH